jgi:hypothetical protein
MHHLSIHIRLVLECPKGGSKIYLEECQRCRFFKGVERLHLFDPWVSCSFQNNRIKVKLAVNCPVKDGAIVEFRKCLGCEHLEWFYGFHDFTPFVRCRPDEELRFGW